MFWSNQPFPEAGLAMGHFIMVGCDLHDRTIMLMTAVDREKPQRSLYPNSRKGRRRMIYELRQQSANLGPAEVIFAYEASGQGFGLHDELTDAKFTCHVLAPTKIARGPRHRHRKTDEKDALEIIELVRAHVLAGNSLPSVWIPDQQTRDDRELVRHRLEVTHG